MYTQVKYFLRTAMCCCALGLCIAGDALPSAPILPPLSLESEGNDLSSKYDNVITIREYVIIGNTVLPEKTLVEIISLYLNRGVSLAELAELEDKLTLAYIERGYVSSGTDIDISTLSQGLLSVEVTEGVLSRIDITTDGGLNEAYLRDRIQLQHFEIVNLVNLEERMQLLEQNPRIKKVESQLLPGMEMGQAVLDVKIQQARPYSSSLEVSNYESPGVGAETCSIVFYA